MSWRSSFPASRISLNTGPEGRSGQKASRFVKGTVSPKPSNMEVAGICGVLKHPLNVLLLCLPAGVAAQHLEWGEVPTFWLNFLALVPLAKILGDAIEELAAGFRNDMLAGLLNSTLGNAVELSVTIQALRAGMIEVVKAMLLGSVLSQLLLVLGMSFFFGGIISQPQLAPVAAGFTAPKKRLSQPGSDLVPVLAALRRSQLVGPPIRGSVSFGRGSVSIPAGIRKSTLMPLVPQPKTGGKEWLETPSRESTPVTDPSRESTLSSKDLMMTRTETIEFSTEVVQTFSRMTALLNVSMLMLSCLSWSLVTVFYTQMARPTSKSIPTLDHVLIPVSRICSIIIMLCYFALIFFQLVTHRNEMTKQEGGDFDDEDHEEPMLSIPLALTIIIMAAGLIYRCGHLLVHSLEGFVDQAHVGAHFIGIVLLPFVGNACDQAAAIRFAVKGKAQLAIGIAVGSSVQISLFCTPFAVLVGWLIREPMDLNFGALNTTVLSVCVIVVLSVVVDGAANWLQGYLLLSAYVMIAVLYWSLPDRLDHIHG